MEESVAVFLRVRAQLMGLYAVGTCRIRFRNKV